MRTFFSVSNEIKPTLVTGVLGKKFVNQHRRDGKREKRMAIAKYFALHANTEN